MRREEERAGHRHERVQGLSFEKLRALMRDDVSDPLLSDVRSVAVVLSIVGCVERSLVRATQFRRARVADAIDLKRVPDLRFVFDGAAAPNDGALGDGGDASCFE